MGRPYSDEMSALPRTFEFAQSFDVTPLAHAVARCNNLPLIAIGSGGSTTAAHFAAALHSASFGRVSRAVTPLEAAESIRRPSEIAGLVLTAGGSNPDILGAFRHLVQIEPQRLIVICARLNSPLVRLVRRYEFVDLIAFDLPSGRDGFLATNSLIATSTLLLRAFQSASGLSASSGKSLRDYLPDASTLPAYSAKLSEQARPLWARRTLVVLHSVAAEAGARDLESRFTEAGLGTVQIADFRQFAHGRHHWLAKHGDESAVLFLTAPSDRALAEKTWCLLPQGIPKLQVQLTADGAAVGLSSIIVSMLIAGAAGAMRGIDPGRPGVPSFGRRIYHLKAFGDVDVVAQCERLPIERKCERNISDLLPDDLVFWRHAKRRFLSRLLRQKFGAVILDYDGTLCACSERFTGIRATVVDQLLRLLRGGVFLGVATGRGKSVRRDLQEKLPPAVWDRVFVGYYNGGDIGVLSDDMRPNGAGPTGIFEELAAALSQHATIKAIAKIEARARQITVEPAADFSVRRIYGAVGRVLAQLGSMGAVTVQSGHSIDILAPGVSKLLLVEHIRQQMSRRAAILCIGDSGDWPGNDSALLSTEFSLSCNTVSDEPRTCWNIAPAGYRGVQATLQYLSSLRVLKKEKLIQLVPSWGM